MRSNQYNPNQAGMNMLKDVETWRKVLKANIHPLLDLESKTEKLVEIHKMDYNELRAAVKQLQH